MTSRPPFTSRPPHGKPSAPKDEPSAKGENDNREEPPMALVDGPAKAVSAYLDWWNGLTLEERWKEYESWQHPAPASTED